MSRAEFASSAEYPPAFQYETVVKPKVFSTTDTLPSDDVSKTQVSSRFAELPKVEPSKSEISLGSSESSSLEETSVSEAFPGPEEPSNVEVSMPTEESRSRYFLDECLGQEAAGHLLGEQNYLPQEEPQEVPLQGLLGLQDPFAEVEAKLARLSSTVARTDAPQADVPKVPVQVPAPTDLLEPSDARPEAEAADDFPPRPEVDLASEVALEVVRTAEPGVWLEAQAPVALVAQPEPLPATAGVKRESVGMEVAVLTDDPLPVVDQQQVLARLQLLEQQVVGGEQAKNKDLKEKHKRRKRYADERRKQLVAALQNSDEDSGDWVLLNVYDSIQEEVRAKSKLLEKMQRKLRAAEVEIKDLQSEFQLEKIDYLATIRRQERDSMLLQQLLEQVQPLIRRDCNYSNLEKILRESCWDEDNGFWKIPHPVITKTSLPQFQLGHRTNQPAKPLQQTMASRTWRRTATGSCSVGATVKTLPATTSDLSGPARSSAQTPGRASHITTRHQASAAHSATTLPSHPPRPLKCPSPGPSASSPSTSLSPRPSSPHPCPPVLVFASKPETCFTAFTSPDGEGSSCHVEEAQYQLGRNCASV
ncbi:kinesin-like protein KIF17 isoform X15 [Homo sapiens]|nr:kinesin-like protein KIF17 isoform X15 [Homo sapiens]